MALHRSQVRPQPVSGSEPTNPGQRRVAKQGHTGIERQVPRGHGRGHKEESQREAGQRPRPTHDAVYQAVVGGGDAGQKNRVAAGSTLASLFFIISLLYITGRVDGGGEKNSSTF